MTIRDLYVGLMSGTSLDGVDAVLADLSGPSPHVLSHAHIGFEAALRAGLLGLTRNGFGEMEIAGRLGNTLAGLYAESVHAVLKAADVPAAGIRAIGCHGQTVRHRPEQGFTLQIGNPALLAERTGIAVVADFRSRDVAAGGQGAPLVPAFHAAVFGNPAEDRAIVNIGGIANVTLLPRGEAIRGFDTGPGNCLMDLWAHRHLRGPMDADGVWAAAGTPPAMLLGRLLAEPYFARPSPKSCGRELFNETWLAGLLEGAEDPQDVQAALLDLTAESIARALAAEKQRAARLIVCGGGARNGALMVRLAQCLAPVPVESSARYGLEVEQVEATAFAWLAKQALEGKAGNIPEVTGAKGPRVLGAVYPA